MTTQRTELVTLPKTFAAIHSEFPGKGNAGLRADLLDTGRRTGRVASLKSRVALTGCGEASLAEVDEICREEYQAKGYDRVFVGDGDPMLYAAGEVVAYLT